MIDKIPMLLYQNFVRKTRGYSDDDFRKKTIEKKINDFNGNPGIGHISEHSVKVDAS